MTEIKSNFLRAAPKAPQIINPAQPQYSEPNPSTLFDMDTLRLQVEAGRNFFIRESQTFAGARIVQMSESDGEKEVRQCQLLLNFADDARLEPNSK